MISSGKMPRNGTWQHVSLHAMLGAVLGYFVMGIQNIL
jgi:hypothetical protein